MAKNTKRQPDDDDGQNSGDWVLAVYHCTYSVTLSFVVQVGGRPRADYHDTTVRYQAYRWNSYHAARKFQRSHPHLRGYIILNLTALEQHHQAARQIREEWIARDRSTGSGHAPTGT